MPQTTSRDFQRIAAQRLEAADALRRAKHTIDAQYIAGYTIECSLKALIMELTPEPDRPGQLIQITAWAKWHKPENLLGRLRDLGVAFPLDLARKLRPNKLKWSTELRYETGRRDTGETNAVLKTAKAIYLWVKEQLP